MVFMPLLRHDLKWIQAHRQRHALDPNLVFLGGRTNDDHAAAAANTAATATATTTAATSARFRRIRCDRCGGSAHNISAVSACVSHTCAPVADCDCVSGLEIVCVSKEPRSRHLRPPSVNEHLSNGIGHWSAQQTCIAVERSPDLIHRFLCVGIASNCQEQASTKSKALLLFCG